MSTEIDNKIVQMEFRNENFEKNAKQSMSTLDTIEKKLQNGSKFTLFDAMQTASEKVNLSGLTSAVDGIASKFSNLGIVGVTALQNITNSAINTGKNLIKSMSVDQVTAGWSKYEQKTASVQTLINSTGQTIDQINAQLDDLMWFSDETSYGFTDMTSALATMTSSGGDIEKLVPMIMGIANSVAYAGKGAQEFSRVMYNLNQSYSSGALTLMDWKSLELAGASSKQLKEELIKAAEAQGKIEKGVITVDNFNATLSDKWADREVMEQAFGVFAQRTMEARQMVKDGIVETGSEAYEILGEKYDDLGMKAANAAQEAKTFVEAIDATKDAVSSGFMQSFEYIFGNYEEAKVLWTDLANGLWEIFASGSEERNELLKGWHDANQLGEGGRTDALWGIYRVIESIGEVITPVKEAFREIFPKITLDQLKNATKMFASLISNIKISDDAIKNIKNTFKGLFTLFKIVSDVIGPFVKIIGNIALYLLPELFSGLMSFTGYLGRLITSIKEAGDKSGILKSVFENIEKILSGIVVPIKNVFTTIKSVFTNLTESNSETVKIFTSLKNILNSVFNLINKVTSKISSSISKLVISFLNIFKSLDKVDLSFLTKIFTKVENFIVPFIDALADAIDKGTNLITGIFDGISNEINKFGEINTDGISEGINNIISEFDPLKSIKDFVSNIFNAIKNLVTGLFEFVGSIFDKISPEIKEKISGIGDIFRSIGSNIVESIKSLNLEKITKLLHTGIFTMLTVKLSGVMNSLSSFLNAKGSEKKVSPMAELVNSLSSVLGGVQKVLMSWQSSIKANIILKIAASIAILTYSLYKLSELKIEQIMPGLSSILILMGGLMASFKYLTEESKTTGRGISSIFKNLVNASMMKTAANQILKISVSTFLLAKAIKSLSDIPAEKLWSSVGAVSAIIAVLVAAQIALNKFGATSSKSAAITIKNVASITLLSFAITQLATALAIISIPVNILGKMDFTSLLKGVGGVIALLAALSGALILLSKTVNPAKLLGVGFAMSTIATALSIISIPVSVLGKMDFTSLLKGVGGVIALLAALSGALILLSKTVNPAKLLGISASIMLISTSLILLIAPIEAIAHLTITQALTAILGISALLALIGVSIRAFPKVSKCLGVATSLILLSSAFTVFAAGTLLLVPAILALSKAANLKMAVGLLAIVGAFALFAAVASALGKKIASIVALSSAFLMFAAAVSVLTVVAPLIASNGESITKAVYVLISSVSSAIKGAAFVLADAAIGVIGELLKALRLNSKSIATELFQFVLDVLETLDTFVPQIVIVALRILQHVFDMIAEAAKSGQINEIAILSIIAAMSAITFLFDKVSKIKKKAKDVLISVGIMTLALAAIGGVFALITRFLVAENWKSILAFSVGFSLVVVALSSVFPLISAIGKMGAKDALVGAGILALAFGAIGAAFAGLMTWVQTIDMSKAMTFVLGLSVVVLALTPALIGLSLVGALWKTAAVGALVLTLFFGAIGAAFAGLMTWVQTIDMSKAMTFVLGLSVVVLALTPAMLLLGIVGTLSGAAIIGAAALVAVVAILGAAMVGLGYLFQGIEQIKPLLESGIEVLGLIGQGIGSFLGGIVYGFSQQALQILPILGEALSGFMSGASQFIEGVKKVDQSFLDGILRLAAAIVVITGAELINSIASIFTQGDPLTKFALQMPVLGAAIMAFAASVSGLKSTDTLNAATNAAKMLGEFMMALPKEGGLFQLFTGTVDLEGFSAQLPALGTNLKLFSQNAEGLNKDTVEVAVNAAKMIGGFIDGFKGIRTGGLTGLLEGDINIQHFSVWLPGLGRDLKQFSINAQGLNAESVEIAVNAAKMIGAWVDNFDGIKTGGVKQMIEGEVDISGFSEALPGLGTSLKAFSVNAEGLNAKSVEQATAAAEMLAVVADMLPEEGGWLQLWSGEKTDLTAFGEGITSLGTSLMTYNNYAKQFETDKMIEATNVVMSLGELAASLSENNGISKFKDFSNAMQAVGDFGVSNFINSLTNSKSQLDVAIDGFIGQLVNGIDAHKERLSARITELKDMVIETITPEYGDFMNVSSAALSEYVTSFENFMTNETYQNMIRNCGILAGAWVGQGMELESQSDAYKQMVSKLIDSAATTLQSSQNTEKMRKAGKFVTAGFSNGMRSSYKQVESAARMIAETAYKEVCRTLDEHSPSRVMEDPGYNAGAGFANGMDKSAPRVRNSARDMARTARQAVQNEVNSGKRGLQLFNNVDLGFNKSDLSGLNDYEKWKEQIYTPNYGELQAATESGADTGNAWANGFESSVTNTVAETTSSTLDAIANAVIRGDWGNGEERMNKLIGAGYDYHEVQNRVNELLGIIKSSVDSASNELDITPTITPVVDTSLMSEGLTGANDYLLTSTGEMSPTYEITSETTSKQLATDIINNDTTNYTEIINEMERLREDLANFAEQAANSQMVLDTGTLVGEITPKIDAQLAQRASYAGRGN